MRAAYSAAGLAPPEEVIWCASPLEALNQLRERGAAERRGESVRAQLVDRIVERTARSVEVATSRAYRVRLWNEAGVSMSVTPSRAVQEALEIAAARSIEARKLRDFWRFDLRSWRRKPQRARPIRSLADIAFSCHDERQIVVYRALHAAGELTQQTAPLLGLWQVVTSCGWMLPFAQTCWLTERPRRLSFDASGRLHDATGPALGFADGWRHHAWKGVAVPAWMIEEQARITPSRIHAERDPIVRRCMIDILTPARFVATSDAVCVSRDDSGALWVKTWRHWDSWAAVEVVNGSPEPDGSFRHYFLQVPPTMRTAREAVAWTYGLSEQDYARLGRRT